MHTHEKLGILSIKWYKNHQKIPILTIGNLRFFRSQNYDTGLTIFLTFDIFATVACKTNLRQEAYALYQKPKVFLTDLKNAK